MGVLACDRAGCKNIMCDNYSEEYGYICYECLLEMKTNKPLNIETFMNTSRKVDIYNIDYDAIFRSRHD